MKKVYRLLAIAIAASPITMALADGADQATKDNLQLQVDILKLQLDKANYEKQLIDAQTKAATPAAAADFTQRSGAVTGADKFGFAIYMSALPPLASVVQGVCTSVRNVTGDKSTLLTSANVPAVTDQWQTTTILLKQMADRLDTLRGTLEPEVKAMEDKKPPTKSPTQAHAAALPAIVGALDVATGLIKGVAGIVNLFRTERAIDGADITFTEKELRGALAHCSPRLTLVSVDDHLLSGNDIQVAEAQLTTLRNAKASFDALLERVRKLKLEDAARADQNKKDKKDETAASTARTARIAQIETDMTAVQTSVNTAIEGFYAPDANSGISKMVAWARATWLEQELAKGAYRLSMTITKAGGYSQAVKHFIADDDLYAAGGVALYYALYDNTGAVKDENLYYSLSDWNSLDLKNTKPALVRTNVPPPPK